MLGKLRKKLGEYWRLCDEVGLAPPPQTPQEQQQQEEQQQRLRQLKRRRIWPLLLGLFLLLTFGAPLVGGAVASPGPPLVAPSGATPTGGTFAPQLTQPATSPSSAHIPADCGLTDLNCHLQQLLSDIEDWWQQQVDSITAYGFIFSTPDSVTDAFRPVTTGYTYTLSIAGSLIALVTAIAGYNLMLGRTTTWRESLPQVLLCGVIAWGFQPLIPLFIHLGNDFIGGLNQVTLKSLTSSNADTSIMGLVSYIFLLVLDLLLAIEALLRLALLDLLIVLAPLGILCYALPQTRAWGRLWAEAFAATILMQPVQAVVVYLGSQFLAYAALLVGPGQLVPPIVQILIGLACVFLALRIPMLLLSRATHVVGDVQHEIARMTLYLSA